MGINYESRSIGSVRAEHLSGRQAVGASELRFSLAWNLHPKGHDVISIFGTRIWVSVAIEDQAQPTPLGQAEPETAWCDETRDHASFDRYVMYRLCVQSAQLLALEQKRQGQPLIFTLDVRGNSYGPNGVRSFDDQLKMRVNVSDWVRILSECGAADVLLVGVDLPLSTEPTRASVELVRLASKHLAQGQYTAAVAECRRAIESLWRSADLVKQAAEARRLLANQNGQRSMGKRDRELALGEAMKNFCHIAHHVGSDAEPEVFGRLDAALAVSTTAALVSSLVADPDLTQPTDGGSVATAVNPVSDEPTATRAPKKEASLSLAQQINRVREHLIKNPKNRPTTLKKLRSVLDSLFAKKLEAGSLDRLLKELVRKKIVIENAGKLTYVIGQ